MIRSLSRAICAACGQSHSIRSPAAHGSWRYDGADGQRPNFCLVLFSLTACLPVPEAGLVLRSIASLWNLYRWTCCISRRRGQSGRASSPASLPPSLLVTGDPPAWLPSPPGPPPVYNSVPDHQLFLRGAGGGGGGSLDQKTAPPLSHGGTFEHYKEKWPQHLEFPGKPHQYFGFCFSIGLQFWKELNFFSHCTLFLSLSSIYFLLWCEVTYDIHRH